MLRLVAMMAGFDGPIYLALGNSRRLALLLLALHASAVVALWVSPGEWNLIFILLVACNALRLQCHIAVPGNDAITALLLDSQDKWTVTCADGRVIGAALARPAFVSPALTSLSLRLKDGRLRHIALLPDNVAHEPFRRLRVRLRHRKTGP